MASNRSEFEQLVDRYDPEVRLAFLRAYDDIRSRVTVKALVARLERGDIEGAIDLLGIDRAAFGPLELAVSNAYNGSGIVFAQNMGRASISFGVRNLIAESILAQYSAQMVTRETESTKAMLRASLSEGLSRGDNPTRTALNMVGRTNRVTGLREGGYLGLSAPQALTQANARLAMLSGDVEGMRAYLGLKTRDKRFDTMVRKAIDEGRALPLTDATRVIGRLNDRQLKYRADVIGLHETLSSLSMSQSEAIRQAIASGKVDARDVTKTWKHTPQENGRLQHMAMNGQTVPFDQPFIAPDGTSIDYPHAPGVPAEHTIGCKCVVSYRIDHTAALIRRRALNV